MYYQMTNTLSIFRPEVNNLKNIIEPEEPRIILGLRFRAMAITMIISHDDNLETA